MSKSVAAMALLAATILGPPALARDYEAVFDDLDRTVRHNFYDPHFGGRSWTEITARYRKELVSAETDAQFQMLGQRMLNELEVSHVALHPPGNDRPTMGLGARLETIAGDAVVVDIDPASGARTAGLRVGDRILNPGDVPGPRHEAALLSVERCDGAIERLRIPRESAYWPPRQHTISWSVLRRGDDRSVGYIRADQFADDAAELIDAAMETVASADGIIIDVRNNSGGNASALRMLSYFSDVEPVFALLSRPFLEGLDGPVAAQDVMSIHRATGAYTTQRVFEAIKEGNGALMLMTEDLGSRRYRKPVIVLIGPGTGSAAEGFAWGARELTSATLVGRDTAGALLSSQSFDLPNGWRVTLPVQGIWGPDGRDYKDKPVPPHVETTLTRKAVCRNEDPDLAAAVSELERAWRQAASLERDASTASP